MTDHDRVGQPDPAPLPADGLAGRRTSERPYGVTRIANIDVRDLAGAGVIDHRYLVELERRADARFRREHDSLMREPTHFVGLTVRRRKERGR